MRLYRYYKIKYSNCLWVHSRKDCKCVLYLLINIYMYIVPIYILTLFISIIDIKITITQKLIFINQRNIRSPKCINSLAYWAWVLFRLPYSASIAVITVIHQFLQFELFDAILVIIPWDISTWNLAASQFLRSSIVVIRLILYSTHQRSQFTTWTGECPQLEFDTWNGSTRIHKLSPTTVWKRHWCFRLFFWLACQDLRMSNCSHI